MASCPKELEPDIRAHRLKMRVMDEQMWMMGMYVQSAVATAIEHNLAGKKAKSEYVKEPMLRRMTENDGLTEEQIYNREVQKALRAEEMWIVASKMKGLPETVIN